MDQVKGLHGGVFATALSVQVLSKHIDSTDKALDHTFAFFAIRTQYS